MAGFVFKKSLIEKIERYSVNPFIHLAVRLNTCLQVEAMALLSDEE